MNSAASYGGILAALAERLPLEKLSFRALVEGKYVPLHRWTWAYYLGGLTLFFFAVQVATGLLLLFYYEPTVSGAHASVEYLTEHVTGGFLIRNLHTWSASLMILCLFLHLLTTFAMKAFERPRELTWLVGVGLLLVAFLFGFTGYLLPWHKLAVNATKVGLQSIEQVGELLPAAFSDWPRRIRETLQGEAAVGQATLSRFYSLHVVVLPLVSFLLIGIHLLGVQLHGLSPGVDEPAKKQIRFFPFFLLHDFRVWGAAFFIVFVLGLCLPFESFYSYPLFEPYDPLGSTPDGIKPEWYFYFLYYPLELLPFWVVQLGVIFLLITLLGAPWIFRGASRRTLRATAWAAFVYLFVITVFGGWIYELFRGGEG
ncbi:MAG: hypothetical protein Kow00109_14690 [Acidobacteriota bacterium]